MCFNSNEALISYIINKIDNENDICDTSINDNNDEFEKIGENNMNEITDIEDIFEEDLLNALDENEVNISTTIVENKVEDEVIINDDLKTNGDNLKINFDNVDDISELIKQLLNNKTLELSIKIKDN